VEALCRSLDAALPRLDFQIHDACQTVRRPPGFFNMIVRTSAPDLLAGIHPNAVDTGWVTDEDPAHLAPRKADEHAFSPPLDVVDGAARILGPVLEGFATGRHPSGPFFRGYRPAPW
jgi:hypothetical protein